MSLARAFLVAGLALGCGAAAAVAAEPVVVPVILSLTGGGAFIGSGLRAAMQVAQASINAKGGIAGRPVRFDYHDDASSPQTSVQIATALKAGGAQIIIGGLLTSACNAAMPLFFKGPVFYCIAPGTHPPDGSYVYANDTGMHDVTLAGIRYLRLRGWRRLAVLTATDATGEEANRNIKDVVALPENAGMTIVEDARFNITDVSVAAQIERIKAADPDVLLAWSAGAPIAAAFRAIAQSGLDIPVVTSSSNQTHAQMQQFAAFLPKRLFFFTTPWPAEGDPRVKLQPEVVAAQQEFYAAVRASGAEPEIGIASGWLVSNIVLRALRHAGPEATAGDMQHYLQHLQGVAGIDGIYDFVKTPQRGLNYENALVTRWMPDRRRWVAMSALGGIPIGR